MNRPSSLFLLPIVVTVAVVTLAGAARADCEADLIQLEQAFKAPNLTDAGKAALDDAKPKAVSALRKDDDAGCHAVIAEALAKAGLTLK